MARLLLVEDDPATHQAYVRLLHQAGGHEVLGAVSGREALRLAKEFDPDVALVDVVLPDISGIEVIRALRRKLPWVPCVTVTSSVEKHHAIEAIEAGACRWLEKPATLENILKAVREATRWLDQQEEMHDLQLARAEPHHHRRLSILAVKYTACAFDFPTLRLICRRNLHHSYGAVKNWCETAKLGNRAAHRFRDFMRGLRAAYRLQHEPGVTEEGLLDIKDDRSLRKFRVWSGGTSAQMPRYVDEYLNRQQFVPDAEFIAMVRRILASVKITIETTTDDMEPDMVGVRSPTLPSSMHVRREDAQAAAGRPSSREARVVFVRA